MFGFGKKKRRSVDSITEYTTELGPDAIFKGQLNGDGNYSIHGKVIGESNIGGILLLEQDGRWEGNMLADVVIVAGTVTGHVMAREKLELRSTGRVEGDLEAPSIAIAEGAIYDGKIKMAKAANVVRYKEKRGVEPEED